MTTRANIYVDQGVDFSTTIDLFDSEGVDYDITDQQFYCYVRKVYSTSVAFQGTIIIDTNDNDENNMELSIPGSVTEDVQPGKYQYDIIMKSGTSTTKILEGLLILLPTITKVA